MAEQQITITHRNHIVVEHPLVDYCRVLLRIDNACTVQLMATNQGLRGFKSLTGRVARWLRTAVIKRMAAVDKKLDTRLAILEAEQQAASIRGAS